MAYKKRQVTGGPYLYANTKLASKDKLKAGLTNGDYSAEAVFLKTQKDILLDENAMIVVDPPQYLICNEDIYEASQVVIETPDGETYTFAFLFEDGSSTILHTHFGAGQVPDTPDTVQVIVDSAITDHEAESDPHEGYILETEKGAVDGVAELDGNSTIPDNQIPSSIARDSELSSHTDRTDNPHSVTKAQVGLSNVDNTSDADKPVSTAQQAAIDSVGGGGGVGSLLFNKDDLSHVNHNKMWTNAAYGDFFWEAWVKPTKAAADWTGYIISDGSGADHNVLFGINALGDFGLVTGNFYNGSGTEDIALPKETVRLGEWCHIAIGWDGATLMTWINGVLSAIKPYTGARQTLSSNGVAFVGGSNHLNFNGNIAQLAGVEGACRFTADFSPERYFRTSWDVGGTENKYNFLSNYMSPASIFPNYGEHEGRNNDGVFGSYALNAQQRVVYDENRPNPQFEAGDIIDPTYSPALKSVPSGALIFDGFSRPEHTHAFFRQLETQNTEGGSLGSLAWSNHFGIRGGKAYFYYQGFDNSLLDAGQEDVEVSVKRVQDQYCRTGIEIRHKDASDRYRVIGYETEIHLHKWEAGTPSMVIIGSSPANWEKLTVRVIGDQMTFLIDDVSFGSAQTITDIAGATKVGICTINHYAKVIWRYGDFTVKAL